jgi:hypothetical protein
MESAADVGMKIFLVGVVFFILNLFFGGITALFEIPTAIQEVGGIQSFSIIIIAAVFVFLASSGISGYIIGYFIAKGSNKPKVS